MTRTVQTLLPAFGGNRTNAEAVADYLRGCNWIGIPFAGGMPELLHLKAGSIVVNDRHAFIINLARVMQRNKEWLVGQLDSLLFHPLTLEDAQAKCEFALDHIEAIARKGSVAPDIAVAYFAAQWMGRSGRASSTDEFSGGIACRWNGNGGGSNKRYRSAIEAIDRFSQVMRRSEFRCMDAFEFITAVDDIPKNGLYLDPPWPDAGAKYVHSFTEDDQRKLRDALERFDKTRIVLRYGNHPLIRKLYPRRHGWRVEELTGRKQSGDQAELWISRRCDG